MAQTMNVRRPAAGRKGAKAPTKRHSAKKREQASKTTRKVAKKLPQKPRKRAAKKPAQARKTRAK